MKAFDEYAADFYLARRPELVPHRSGVAEAAAVYLLRFDTALTADYVQEALSAFFRRVADAVGWSSAESRRVSLRVFHEASTRYFSTSWHDVSVFVDANAALVAGVRRAHARRMDIITNGLGPDENAVRAVDGADLDRVLAGARPEAPVVVKVFADYCSTCAEMAPAFEAAARALYPKTLFAAVDGPRNLDVVQALGCGRYPCVLKFLSPDGKPVRCESRDFSEHKLVAFACTSDSSGGGGGDGSSSRSEPRSESSGEGGDDSSTSEVDGASSAARTEATPVDRARAISAETDPDPTGALMGQWARMLRRQGIDQLEALVADRDVALLSKTDDALQCSESGEGACPTLLPNGEVLSDEDPVAILLGGGMGSGKSGSMHSLSQTAFWKARGAGVVVVEADAYKHVDPVFRSLSAIGVEASRAVHGKSLEHAESLFLKAVSARRDVVLDGTLSWKPFVEQTLAMLRDTTHVYTRGSGARTAADGTRREEYWVRGGARAAPARPYRVEIVGVTVDAAVAVERGVVRRLLTGRGVPVRQQLASHRLFSAHFAEYVAAADGGYLFDMSAAAPGAAAPAIVAARRGILFPAADGAAAAGGGGGGALVVENADAYRRFLRKAHLNCDAARADDLFFLAAAGD